MKSQEPGTWTGALKKGWFERQEEWEGYSNSRGWLSRRTKTGRVEWTCWLCKDHIDPFFKNDITIILNEKKMVDSADLWCKTLSILKGILTLDYYWNGNRNTPSFKSYLLLFCCGWNIERQLHQLGMLLRYLSSPEGMCQALLCYCGVG